MITDVNGQILQDCFELRRWELKRGTECGIYQGNAVSNSRMTVLGELNERANQWRK